MLLRAGIGPAQDLRDLGIPVLSDQRGVGRGFERDAQRQFFASTHDAEPRAAAETIRLAAQAGVLHAKEEAERLNAIVALRQLARGFDSAEVLRKRVQADPDKLAAHRLLDEVRAGIKHHPILVAQALAMLGEPTEAV